jgi:hypothetical protein
MTDDIEERVAQHYAHGTLDRAISDALAASGVNTDRLAPADLAPVDEFHIGGRQAAFSPSRQGVIDQAHGRQHRRSTAENQT